jgi:hypothetical protein
MQLKMTLITVTCSCVWACVPVCAAGNITCTVAVENTGTVRISNVKLASPANNVQCSMTGVLWPGQNYTCDVTQAVNQLAFDTREANDASTSTELTVAVTATGTPNVTTAMTFEDTHPTEFTGLQLPIHRTMTASDALSAASVTSKGGPCLYSASSLAAHASCMIRAGCQPAVPLS